KTWHLSRRRPRQVALRATPLQKSPRLAGSAWPRAEQSPDSKQSAARREIGAELLPIIARRGLHFSKVQEATPPNADRCRDDLDLSTDFAHNSRRLLQTSLLLPRCGLRAAGIALHHPVPV